MFVHVLSFECCAILRTFECRGSLLWAVRADKLFILSSKSVLMEFQNLADMSSRHVHDLLQTESCSLAACCVPSSLRQTNAAFWGINQRRRCVVSLYGPWFLRANYLTQNSGQRNCLHSGKGVQAPQDCLGTPTNMFSVLLFRKWKYPVAVTLFVYACEKLKSPRLLRPQLTECLEEATYARALRSIHLFSLLLEGGQFYAYLTTQAQNAVPRTFAFLTYQLNLPILECTL